MENITGKILVFTDLHLGLKSGSKSRLAICINVIKEIISYIKENDIQACIFLGDWHHVRASTENNILNASYKLMSALAKQCKIYCLIGNHDIYMKNTVDINSLVIFKDITNVTIISTTSEVSINGNKTLLVPWLGDISGYKNETFDMMFGHFETSQKFYIKQYIEDHSSKISVSKNISDKIDNDNMLNSNVSNLNSQLGDYVGDFVKLVKKNGNIFSGHIHKRREFIAKGRNFIFVGDPYQQDLGEKEYECGFYVIDKDNSYKFYETKSAPRHIELRISNITKNIDDFDFSIIKGNIVHKIYDIEIDPTLDAKISQRINDIRPYEELLPDYEVDIDDNPNLAIQNASIELIKKSKLNYIKSYIENIDENLLNEQYINPDKLYSVLEEYYNNVTEEK